MELDPIGILAVLLVGASAITLFMSADWRLSIVLLALQYCGVFLLVSLEWPLGMAVVKLVAGWIAGAVLGMAIVNVPQVRAEIDAQAQAAAPHAERARASRLFYLLATLLVVLVVISQADQVTEFMPDIRLEQVWGGLLLVAMGLLKLGFTLQPFPAVLGLLTALSGFETIYASIERSALVAGQLAGVNLGLALIGAYLMVAPYMQETE